MAQAKGYITVFEASDGGTGNPCRTLWQFFVCSSTDRQAVRTENHWIAETALLAIKTNALVQVEYDATSSVVSQVRMTFDYVCESSEVEPCAPPESEPKVICETRRYTSCKPANIPPAED